MVKSIFIEAREWFDKLDGNSYWSAEIQIDGKIVLVIPMTYGYEFAYLHESLKSLHEKDYIPTANLWDLRQLGVHVYHTKHLTTKNKMFKADRERTCQ